MNGKSYEISDSSNPAIMAAEIANFFLSLACQDADKIEFEIIEWNNNYGYEADMMNLIGVKGKCGGNKLNAFNYQHRAFLIQLIINTCIIDWGIKIMCKGSEVVVNDQILSINVPENFASEYSALTSRLDRLRCLLHISQ